MSNNPFKDFPVISSYTRQEAIDDGTLINITDITKQRGFKFPVCITSRLYACLESIPKKYSLETVRGRINDILDMLIFKIQISKEKASDIIYFQVIIHDSRNSKTPKRLYSRCSAGDNMEPVITIMFEDED